MRDLVGQWAAVTGSTSGIGRAIAVELASAGANVIIHGRRSEARAQDVVRECQHLGVEARYVLRISAIQPSEDDRRNLPGAGASIFGSTTPVPTRLPATRPAGGSSERKLEELWRVDVQATLDLGRNLGERTKARKKGVIVNMGWDQAETGMEGDSGRELFGAVKGAIMCFSKSLALSLAPHVRVHCIAPGWIQTAWGEQASTVWQERVRARDPVAPMGATSRHRQGRALVSLAWLRFHDRADRSRERRSRACVNGFGRHDDFWVMA